MRLRQFARELWYLQRRSALAVLGCALVSLWLAAFEMPRQRMKFQQVREAEIAAGHLLQQAAALPAAPPVREDLPPAARLAALLPHLATAGQREHLRVGEITSRPVVVAGGVLQRHEVSLTLSGPFPETRALLAELLKAYPSLTLDSIAVSREAPETPRVETQLRLSLYTRP
jgi:hypothetical protein